MLWYICVVQVECYIPYILIPKWNLTYYINRETVKTSVCRILKFLSPFFQLSNPKTICTKLFGSIFYFVAAIIYYLFLTCQACAIPHQDKESKCKLWSKLFLLIDSMVPIVIISLSVSFLVNCIPFMKTKFKAIISFVWKRRQTGSFSIFASSTYHWQLAIKSCRPWFQPSTTNPKYSSKCSFQRPILRALRLNSHPNTIHDWQTKFEE